MKVRNLALCVLWAFTFLLFFSPLRTALLLGLSDDRYVSVIAAPVIFPIVMYWDRKRIFNNNTAWDPAAGLPVFAIALSGWFVVLRRANDAHQASDLSLAVLTVVAACAGAFILCYGRRSFEAALFPFSCLLLVIPVPVWVMDQVTAALQHGSAAVSVAILRLFGVPVFAQDTHLSLPGLDLQVAPECSGIHSCLSLFLVTLVISRIFLRSGVSRLILVISTIPLAVVKNAVRISVIAALSAYVDRAYLNSPIHHYGGFVFTPLEIALLAGLLIGLRGLETAMARRELTVDPRPEVVEQQTAVSVK